MKLRVYLFMLVTVAAAAPAPHHGDHHHSVSSDEISITSQIPEMASAAATTTKSAAFDQDDNRSDNLGKDRGGVPEGNQGSQQGINTTTRPQGQKTNTVTVIATVTVTATGRGGQATNTAGAGQNAPGGQGITNGIINPSLVPDFGQQAGLAPDGTGNCKTNTGKLIPCQCPPDRGAFIAKLEQFVKAGSFFGTLPAPFPTSNSNKDALARINTIISTLQNFNGKPGVGCPAISAPNFAVVQSKLLQTL